ncbi:hypothetical protein SAMN05661012_01302 [Chitinophaga sancti]|uniref:Uncharacterized protein n=1 Tax=Chitinophaga sancti TaxID=1004 RepID=A0A1K1NH38_9BACT|nr:hypothetical protein SAMN05661012_01302 [Chitinophaga sancti]
MAALSKVDAIDKMLMVLTFLCWKNHRGILTSNDYEKIGRSIFKHAISLYQEEPEIFDLILRFGKTFKLKFNHGIRNNEKCPGWNPGHFSFFIRS